MKTLNKYLSPISNAFFNYLKDDNEIKLYDILFKIESLCRVEYKSIDSTLGFRFGEDDTLVYTINDILNDLSNKNREFMLENFNRVTKDTNPYNEIIIYFN